MVSHSYTCGILKIVHFANQRNFGLSVFHVILIVLSISTVKIMPFKHCKNELHCFLIAFYTLS